jgi:hypothetical protein
MHDNRADAAYLRAKAAQFRDIATTIDLPIRAELLNLADEMEAYAAAIERRSGRGDRLPKTRMVL